MCNLSHLFVDMSVFLLQVPLVLSCELEEQEIHGIFSCSQLLYLLEQLRIHLLGVFVVVLKDVYLQFEFVHHLLLVLELGFTLLVSLKKRLHGLLH